MALNQLPTGFKASIEHLVKDWSAFEQSLLQEPSLSIRLHPQKFSTTPTLASVPWCKHGFYLEQRPVFTFDPLFQSGVYYVQEAGSMLLWHILEQLFPSNRDLKVLDLCAAPGGKSTLILSWLNGNGFLVANEVIGKRARVLEENIDKWGYANRMITNSDPERFEQIGEQFDVIVVDAPCSGEGMFRKEEDAVSMWSTENVQHCHLRQKRILDQAMAALKPGGYLIYSTCTYNETENEGSLSEIASKYNAQSVDIATDNNWDILRSEKDGIIGFRCFPHKVRSEGFFTSVLQKQESSNSNYKQSKKSFKKKQVDKNLVESVSPWLKQPELFSFLEHREEVNFLPNEYHEFALNLTSSLHVLSIGTNAGKIIRNELIPNHSLALSIDLNSVELTPFELNDTEVLAYLKKDSFSVKSEEQGLVLCTYRAVPCGWAKIINGKLKNAYPIHLRIQHSQAILQSIL